MNVHPFKLRSSRGSALVAVVFIITIMSLLSASVISYSISERRSNERQRLLLRARNMAENAALYASEQVTTKLYRLRSMSPIAFTTGSNKIYLPPSDVLTTSFSTDSDTEILGGLTSTTGLSFIDPSDPANATNPNVGLQASTSLVPIIAKSTMSHDSVGGVTAYAKQDLQVSLIPLFQFAIFYNQDLEFSPGANMVISGPVHANGNLIARCQTYFTNTVQFTDRVTASGGFYADTGYKGTIYMGTGSSDSGPGGTGPLYFQDPAGNVTNIKSGSTWRDHKYGQSNESATTLSQFKSFATSTYGGNLRTSVHGVTDLVLPGVDNTANTNSGRSIIDPPDAGDSAGVKQTKFARNAGLYIIVNPDDDARSGILPDATTVRMLPRSYRCWLNTVNSNGSYTITEIVLPGQPSYGYDNNGTPADFTDDKMYPNDLPNRFTNRTAVGMNQVLRMSQSGRTEDTPVASYAATTGAGDNMDDEDVDLRTGYLSGTPVLTNSTVTIPDAYFYDMRRADNSEGYPFNRSASDPFKPRPILKLDFDMLRFRLAVERTVEGRTTSTAIYNPDYPSATNWSSNIFNHSATRSTVSLYPTDYTSFPVDASGDIISDPFKIYFPSGIALATNDLINTSTASPWFDGITIYVHSVDAEARAAENDDVDTVKEPDSGVRLINGRGAAISLSGSTYPGRTGLSFGTNDALYIIGHFNADGIINSNKNSTTAYGGYSARYPDSADEMLVSVMGDSLTILSQPKFTSGTIYDYNSAGWVYPLYTAYQTSGWSDTLSGHSRSTSGWSSSWATSNPSGSNSVDGITKSTYFGVLPWDGTGTVWPYSHARTRKFAPSVTEVSACMLTGIVPTDSHQHSGGVHNFPRLLEQWSTTGLYIRGSMVTMFDSEVATEPWSIRIYTGAGRYWGLHQNLRTAGHDIPLEPVVLNAQRLHYTEIDASEYATLKATIEALPN